MNPQGYKNLCCALITSAIKGSDILFLESPLGETCCIIAGVPIDAAIIAAKRKDDKHKRVYNLHDQLYSLTELSNHLKLHPSTVHRYLNKKQWTAEELATAFPKKN